MFKNITWCGLALAAAGVVAVPSAQAGQRWDDKTRLTFSEPVEVPGHVLPAGTYTFKLLDSMSDRHIVRIFNADGSQVIATIMTIPDQRLKATDNTVIKFTEMPSGSPEAIRAWFYPGHTIGQEFVYSKRRAAQLAKVSHTVVPALTIDVTDEDAMKTAEIVAITPDEKEVPVAVAMRMPDVAPAAPAATVATAAPRARELPHTATAMPLVAVLGFGAIALALGLAAFGKRGSNASA
ncbi:MAG: hypothetical protein ABI665_04330 [Vicinamibacterales bacterium]